MAITYGYVRVSTADQNEARQIDAMKLVGICPEKTRAVELLRRVEEFNIHFNRYYLSPLLEKGVIARTDPDHPQSPQQMYCLT